MDYINIFILIAGAMFGLDEFLVAAIFLYYGTRDQDQSNGTLAEFIQKANKNRVDRLNKHRNTPIPVDTNPVGVPAFPI